MTKKEEDIKDYKTKCCRSTWFKDDKDYFCSECKENVTLELSLFYQTAKSKKKDEEN